MAGWFDSLPASRHCACGAAAEFGEHNDALPRTAPGVIAEWIRRIMDARSAMQ
jgi:hypothetical protein